MMNKQTKKILAGVVASAAMVLPGIASVPVEAFGWDIVSSTIQGVSAYKELDKQMDYYDNTEEGRQEILKDYKKKYGVVNDPARIDELQTIMGNLTNGIGAVDPSVYDKLYYYWICPDQSFNAFCTFGHVLCVHEGLWNYLDNPAEIAVVLGHEMGHGQKNHVSNAVRKKIKTELGAGIVSGALSGNALGQGILNVAVNQLETVTISRGNEWEADNLAFDYIYQAGYNPGASAATWQHIIDKIGDNDPDFAKEVFSPSDHPSNSDRRDNYEKKLVKLSGNHVTIKKGTDTVEVNKKEFVTPSAAGSMSGAERKYFIMGNLAAAYDHKEDKKAAVVKNGSVYLGDQNIMTPVNGDPSAEDLVALLNRIK